MLWRSRHEPDWVPQRDARLEQPLAQCSGYDAGIATSPEVITGGTYAAGSTTVSSVRCSIQGDNSQPALP